ncbi:HD domain-containing protein [Methanolobus psychrotolerans]|uniref:HD domain-containing protein n=1 Tax=Methanolobus psychrotolerans TaxID=1874706 RepID=UPI000B919B82|nr:HD domain-containing protein [Methanolobus psychrotolerans]
MDLIETTRQFVAKVLAGEPSTHDMSHIERVENTCIRIHEKEGGDLQVLRLAALLHDVGIVKEHEEGGNHAQYSAEIAREFLNDNGAEAELIDHVASCILSHRFSRGMQAQTIEAKILQDADRIDALGAVGIFRSLVSMGALRTLKQTIGTVKETSMNAYTEDPFDGFYEYMEKKPFKIKDRLNTETAKEIADQRLTIMQTYLEQLKEETTQERDNG